MAQLIADRRDIDFVLHELLEVETLTASEKFNAFNRRTFDLIVSEARRFALKEMLPAYPDGDRIGVRYESDGRVQVPDSFHRVHQLYLESEWTAPSAPPEYGGQGLPHVIRAAVEEYFMGANWALCAYGSMGAGTAHMIQLYGTEEQKRTFLEKINTGRWGGTMLLTEPEAGTDVGSLTTTAVRNPDGTFNLTGNKIFITNGEHDLVENIIHPVLARVENDPPGTKGISIFIVPKYLVNPDGSLGQRNDIVCTGVEEKHGIHGSATCSMALGSRGPCTGFLLGEERQGMKIMFHMMNGARLGTGLQALAHASTSYLYALDYARQRIQGRDIADFMDRSAPSVPIIRHPDVRRMLMWMKAHVEGLRALIYLGWHLVDRIQAADDDEEKESCLNLLELLTPIIKGYGSERGYDVCINGIQVFGGAGYIRDYPVEAIARDCKITTIFEGCTGIQAADLLGRKLGLKKGAVCMDLLARMKAAAERAGAQEATADLARRMDAAIDRLGAVALHMGQSAMSDKFRAAFAHSLPFLDVMGDVVMGWMHLWRATVAAEKMSGAKKKDRLFYVGQIKTAEFFIRTILPGALGRMDAIEDGCDAAVAMDEAAFGG
ncbi:MAG: acyl-CoA dehydrogenase [Desulfobacterales bacterium]|nr:acyl-CoA dehydrogenase [Desulfobacterales bacterium]